ncbi:MAG: hypothetical protein J5863_09390 [Desulfovibrio sp.]|nr:hypothetical protein [Desulfovibrio sp.]
MLKACFAATEGRALAHKSAGRAKFAKIAKFAKFATGAAASVLPAEAQARRLAA